ncbi:MAG: hypothetical protein MJ094_09055 [Saccharofermentans sp.]|nr:hypothetical protein [Saccharofermentans sp.]
MSVTGIIAWIVVGILAIGLPTWFIISLVAYKKDKKDTTKPKSTGLYVNLIFSIVGFVAWCICLILIIAFFILASLIVANM